MSSHEVVAFLRARLAEDECDANDAALRRGPVWVVEDRGPAPWGHDEPAPAVLAGGKLLIEGADGSTGALAVPHIARHDPARVLAEIAAKRQIIDEWVNAHREAERGDFSGQVASYCFAIALAALTSPYTGHTDYREEWKV